MRHFIHQILFIPLILISACGSGQALPASKKIIIPFTYVQGRPVIQISLPGKNNLKYVFDTGKMGEEIATDQPSVAGLNLQTVDSLKMGDPSGKNNIVLPVVNIPQVKIGGIEFSNAKAAVNNRALPGVSGIIGLAFFKDYLVRLDLTHNRLILEKGEISAADKDAIAYASMMGIPVVDINIGEHHLHAHMDSGNSRAAVVLPDSVVKLVTFAGTPATIGQANSLFNKMDMKEGQIKETLTLGKYKFAHPTVSYPAFGDFVNLGNKFLRQFIIKFDQKNQKMNIEKVSVEE